VWVWVYNDILVRLVPAALQAGRQRGCCGRYTHTHEQALVSLKIKETVDAGGGGGYKDRYN